MKITPDYETELMAVTACLTALAECGIPTDTQELLLRGNASQGIAPHALFQAVRAVYNTYRDAESIK